MGKRARLIACLLANDPVMVIAMPKADLFVCGIADALAPGRGFEPLQGLERRQPLKIDRLLHSTPARPMAQFRQNYSKKLGPP